MKNTTKTLLAATLGALLLTGCQSARVANPLTEQLAGNEPDQQLDFWHTLATRNVTSNDEAFHGLLLFLDSEDPATTYEERVRILKERRMIPQNFDAPADAAVNRGDLAVAVCKILEIRGGLLNRITKTDPRYATRELVFMDVYPPSSPQQTFSGNEYLGIIGRVEDFQRGNPASVPAAVMPGEIAKSGKKPPTPQELYLAQQ